MSNNRGKFVWYDLNTPDPAAAIEFYTQVVGWKTEPFGKEGDYQMLVGARGPIGGVMTLADEAKAMGAPPHWLAYVEVPDIHASAAQVKALGGTVFAGPFPIPDVGQFAVIGDPQGALIALFTPQEQSPAPEGPPQVGEYAWAELLTSDVEGALAFYGPLFGWVKTGEMPMPPMGVYTFFGQKPEEMLGGMMVRPAEMPVSAWGHYVTVADLDASVAKAQDLGGRLIFGPSPIPGGGRIAMMMDPQGAAFNLVTESAPAAS